MTLADLLATALEAPLGSLRGAQRAPAAVEQRDAIVVLGARLLAGGQPPRTLRERGAAAAELFARGGAPIVIAAGGVTRAGVHAEADAIAAQLIAAGVPADAIVCERGSQTTAENAARVGELAVTQARPAGARVWLVTQPFHARRAAWLFARAGMDAAVWPMPDSIQFHHRRRATRWLVREYAAWVRLAAVTAHGRLMSPPIAP